MFCSILVLSMFFNVQTDINMTTISNGSFDRHSSLLWSCQICHEHKCRCSSTPNILDCSSYEHDLLIETNCTSTMTWDTVDFSLRNLQTFDMKQLLPLRMHRFLLQSNFISYIADQTFDSLADVLDELDLSLNFIDNVSSHWLNSKFIQLKHLNLASNRIESFVQLDGIELRSLQQLNLSRNRLSHFPRQIQQWTSLVTLDLSFNRLSSIPRFALIGLHNLTWLSIAANRNLTCKSDIRW
jgi:Leucine-rich repeat (LRR) protein